MMIHNVELLIDIMNHVLVLEMFQQFSNTQTYLNKQTMSWCKDFLCRHVFLIAFVKVDRNMSTGDSASFLCQGVTQQQEP